MTMKIFQHFDADAYISELRDEINRLREEMNSVRLSFDGIGRERRNESKSIILLYKEDESSENDMTKKTKSLIFNSNLDVTFSCER